jgi:hypothetical protein
MREIIRVEAALLARCSLGITQQGSCLRYRDGYVSSISDLTVGRLAFVGTLCRRNFVHRLLILVSVGFSCWVTLAMICR